MGRAIGRESNLKFFVNSKDLDKLSELVKTKDREKLLWGTIHERINDILHDIPVFFSACFFLCQPMPNAISLFRMDLSLWDKDP